MTDDPRIAAVPDIHGHAKGEHKLYVDERPIPYTARMLFLWFFHACRRGAPRFLMVADHINYLTFEDPAAVNLVRRALKLAQAGDLYGAAETAGVEVAHAGVVGEGLRRGMRYSIGAEVDNDPRSRPDAQNIVDAMRPDGIVRSIHFLPITHPQFGENWMWPFDNPEFRDLYDVVGTDQTWELYMATLLDAIEKLPGHIVGHFYVPGKFGHWPSDEVLESYEDRLLDACAERGMAVEINARTFYKYAVDDEAQLEKYRAVNLRLLRKAKDKGVAIAVGSDAHSPKDQGRGFSEILALLDEAEVNEIAFPIDGRMARVALRATDELRQASARSGGAKDQTEIAIPGTEESAPLPDTIPESVPAAKAPEPVTSPAPATSPKKRPSRAKKPALAAAAPDAAPADVPTLVATAPESAAPAAQKIAEPAPSSSAETPGEGVKRPVDAAVQVESAIEETPFEPVKAPEKSPLESPAASPEAQPERAIAAQDAVPEQAEKTTPEPPATANAEAAPDAEAEPDAEAASGAEAASAVDTPSEGSAVAATRADEAPEAASNEGLASGAPAETDGSSAPVTALAAVAAVASAAVAAVVSATKKRTPAAPLREPAEPARTEGPKRARPVKTASTAKAAPSAKAEGAKLPSATKSVAAPKSAAASKPVVAAKPAATPPKRGAKAVAKPAARSSVAAKATSAAAKATSAVAKATSAVAKATPVAAKTSSAAAKKRVVVKAAPKKAAPARAAAPTGKKAAAKKTAAVRKPVSKVVSKTASRASVKKTNAKKTAKKKTTKQRR